MTHLLPADKGPRSTTFETVQSLGEWVPIRDCPGRFVMRGVLPNLSLADLLGTAVSIREYPTPMARDRVFVACIDGGGAISYLQSSGLWIHTLGTEDGFSRKLKQLGIHLDENMHETLV